MHRYYGPHPPNLSVLIFAAAALQLHPYQRLAGWYGLGARALFCMGLFAAAYYIHQAVMWHGRDRD